jgi:hypothetical protein
MMSRTTDHPRSTHTVRIGSAAIGLAAVASAVMVMATTVDGWFRWDAWDFIQYRSVLSLAGLFGPHGGGLQWFTVVFYRSLINTVGFDYWPWFVVPYAVGYPLLIIGMWRFVVRRGAGMWLATATAVGLMFMASSSYLYDGAIGQLVSVGAGLVAVSYFDADVWTRGRQITAATAVFLMLTTADIGVSLYVGLVVGTALYRRSRAAVTILVPAGLFYGAWYFRTRASRKPIDVSDLLGAPRGAFDLLRYHLPDSFGFSTGLGAAITIGAVAAMVYALRDKRHRPIVTVWTVALGSYLGLLWVVRIAPGEATIETIRYGLWPTALLYVAILPSLPKLNHTVEVSLSILLVATSLFANIPLALDERATTELQGAENRRAAEAAMTLIRAGEPYHLRGRLDMSGGWATPEGLLGMQATGWNPPDTSDATALRQARLGIRTRLLTSSAAVRSDSCTILDEGTSTLLELSGRGRLILEPADRWSRFLAAWDDEWGSSERNYALATRSELQYVAVPNASLSIKATTGTITVCEPSDRSPGF